jgi:hypothetical protein
MSTSSAKSCTYDPDDGVNIPIRPLVSQIRDRSSIHFFCFFPFSKWLPRAAYLGARTKTTAWGSR